MKKIGLISIIVGATVVAGPTQEQESKPQAEVRVGAVRLVTGADWERGISPLSPRNGYTLALILELPERNLKIKSGRVRKAVTDTGQDILYEGTPFISQPELSEDEKAVVFEVNLSLPDQGAKGLTEVSGVLRGFKFTGTKKIDLGLMDFKDGTKSKVDGFSITSLEKKLPEEGSTYMHIGVNLPYGSVEDVKLYREDGSQIAVFYAGSLRTKDGLVGYNVRTEGEFPPKGRIVFEVLEGIATYEIPFKLTNISLLGQPL
ncbi:MAG: hypothetical protein ACYS83_05235 [Planctomycetota bacterium]|jgi:hypothetical protein